jgi:hypothetical protein
MPPDLSAEAWAQIRHDYEPTDRPVDDICAEHGISAGTLRDRMRRWGWTRRRGPIMGDGQPPVAAPRIDIAPPHIVAERAFDTATPPHGDIPPYGSAAPNDRAIVPRLQSAVTRVVSAIEATVATLGAGPAHPREMERTARVLAALTRTLSELNGLLRQHGAAGGRAAAWGEPYKDVETLRRDLAKKLQAFAAAEEDEADGGEEELRRG